uniref:Uncharacterized protein n=1 Tax=Halamphora americana TaxID=2305497 RepID=A0A516ZB55_9STRA|nr:hypothetical protein [Halamphora americana]QDR24929.1 hypothetical protein [Halamphora americana]
MSAVEKRLTRHPYQKSVVVRELSLALYGVKNCKSIKVKPTDDVDSLDQYCLKPETRLVLPATGYYPPSVDVPVSEFIQVIEEEEELKKFMTILVCLYQRLIFELIRMKTERQGVHFSIPKAVMGNRLQRIRLP